MVADHTGPTPSRTDATTMLAEGSRETRLSPRDVGRIAELRLVAVTCRPTRRWRRTQRCSSSRWVWSSRRARRTGCPATNRSSARPRPTRGSRPSRPNSAAISRRSRRRSTQRRRRTARHGSPPSARRRRRGVRNSGKWAQQATAARDQADLALTARVDAALDANPGHVFDRLIIGGGWAATADFVSLGAPADTGDGVPPVLAVSLGNDPWGGRGELLMGQVPNELEIDGFPFQTCGLRRRPHRVRAVERLRRRGWGRTSDLGHADVPGRGDQHRAASRAGGGMARRRAVPGHGRRAHVLHGHDRRGRPALVQRGSRPTERRPASGSPIRRPASASTTRRRRRPAVTTPARCSTRRTLPEQVQRVLGYDPVTGVFGAPQLADQQGRLTNPWVLDPASGLRVDPATAPGERSGRPAGRPGVARPRHAAAPRLRAGRLLRRSALRPARVGLRDPPGERRHRRDVHRPARRPVDARPGDPDWRWTTRSASRRVQFGGENTSDRYQPGDRVLIFGAGASGAWDTEQAQRATPHVDWVARTAVRDELRRQPAPHRTAR